MENYWESLCTVEMFSIVSNKGSANQDNTEIPLMPTKMAVVRQSMPSVGENVVKLELSCILVGM